MKNITDKMVRDEAYRAHKCPKGYKEPCWGPGLKEFNAAKNRLIRAEDKEKTRG